MSAVKVIRSGPRRSSIFMIDGEPYLIREAAVLLGMPVGALQKRLERGTSVEKEYAPKRRARPTERSRLLREWHR